MDIVLAVILGGLFGFALTYVGATTFKNILKMLRLEDLSLAKIILFAIGFSSVLLGMAGIIGVFDISHLSIKNMNLGVIVGGLIFGVAFGSIGTCPGTCIGAVGNGGVKKGIAAILGGLLGAFIFSLTYGYFRNFGMFEVFNLGKLTLFNISPDFPSIFNVGFAGLLIVGIGFMLLSYFIPKQILKK